MSFDFQYAKVQRKNQSEKYFFSKTERGHKLPCCLQLADMLNFEYKHFGEFGKSGKKYFVGFGKIGKINFGEFGKLYLAKQRQNYCTFLKMQ